MSKMFNACDLRQRVKLLALGFIAIISFAESAAAQTCMATITTPITFAGFDVLSGAAVDTTATLNISCSGLLSLLTVSICPSIEAGSAGQTDGVRHMQRVSGTETLNFGLFRDAARTIPWGSLNDPSLGDPPLIVLVVPVLGGTANRTIYARLFGGQTGIAPGTYQSDFLGSQTEIRYGVTAGLTDCNGVLTALTKTTTAPFIIQTTVAANCLLSVLQDVDFGTAGLLSANADGTGQLQVTCTSGTGYTVSLQRQAGSLPLGSWEMTKGAEVVTYGLYSDVSRTDLWGDLPADLVSAAGTGAAQLLDVYGRVPPQTTPSPGTYTDTVVVTVTY